MPEVLPLTLRFKGQRDYVQGPDLHDAVCSALHAYGHTGLSKINFVVHRLVRGGASAHLDELLSGQPHDAGCAVFQFESAGKHHTAHLVPNGENVEKREEFPEERIIDACGIDLEQQRIVLERPIPFSSAEAVVSMNKALLQKLFPNAGGKWLFTRFQLDKSIWPEALPDLKVTLQANLNFAVTRSGISSAGRSIGHVYFSLVR